MSIFASLLISDAFAQSVDAAASATPAETSPLAGMLPFLLILVVMYFFMIRPQNHRYKEQMAFIKAVKKGDKVLVSNGIIGTVTKAAEGSTTVTVELAPGASVEVTRSALSAYTPAAPATAPAKTKKAAKADKDADQSIANDN